MTFPGNAIEVSLAAAARGELPFETFLGELLDSLVWVPLAESTGQSGAMPTITIDNRPYVPAFTSEAQLRSVYPSVGTAVPPLREHATVLPDHVGIAVNPGGEVGLPLTPEDLQQAMGGISTLAAGTKVRLGEPAEEPTQLLDRVAAAFGGIGAVRSARRCWAQVGDGRPGLVLGVDIDPDNAATRRAVLDAVGAVTGHNPAAFPVDVVFTNDHDVFTSWMNEHTEPFYRRQ